MQKNSSFVNIQNNNKSRGIKTKAGIRTRLELAFCLQKPSIHADFFTRSFSAAVTELANLVSAVTRFASDAAVKLRAQGSKAGQLQVFAHTSAFRPGPAFSCSVLMTLRRPTSDTVALVNAAVTGIRAIYRPGFSFAKAEVMLLDLQDGDIEQKDLEPEPVAHGRLMGALGQA